MDEDRGGDVDDGRDEITTAQLAALIRRAHRAHVDIRDDAVDFIERVMRNAPPMPRRGWLRRLWVSRHARFARWHAARVLRALDTDALYLNPANVRRVFAWSQWPVVEDAGILYVDGYQVWPDPPMALADTIDVLELRRGMGRERFSG